IAIEVSGIDTHPRLSLPVSINCTTREQRVVNKRTVLLVDPELVLIAIVCDIDIDPAIVVEVGSDDPQSVSKLLANTRGGGYVFKNSVAFVVEQTIAGRAKGGWLTLIFRGVAA